MDLQYTDFRYKTGPEPHRQRTKALLESHPEVRHLIGKNPWTALIILGCVIFQIVMAYLLREQSWWWIVGVAWFVGAFPAHVLFVCIHEAAHHLIFRKREWNIYAGIFANLPTLLPSAISFKNYHLKHHVFQGVHELDADLPSRWEARLINNYFIGKALWLLFYPFFQALRVLRCREAMLIDRWVLLNVGVQLAFDVAVVYFLGWKAFAYLGLSLMFSIGLHPLGARWIQEHYLVLDPDQETYSYYGPLNRVNLNVGYHNEHHDMPSVPWNNLPKLRAMAPEFYNSLKHHKSYTRLLLRFLFSQEISLFSRIVRKDRGGVPLSDESTPDIALIEKSA